MLGSQEWQTEAIQSSKKWIEMLIETSKVSNDDKLVERKYSHLFMAE